MALAVAAMLNWLSLFTVVITLGHIYMQTLGPGRPNDQIDREKLILDSAIELFAHNGFENTGVRSIAEASNVSFGLVRHYFGSKEDLIEACNTYAMEHIATYFSEAHNVIYDNIEERLSEQSWVKQTVSLVTPKVIYFRYFLQLLLSGKDADHQRFKEYYNTVSTHIDDMDKINPISKEFPRHWVVLQYIFLQLGVPLLVDQINAVTGRDAYSPKNIRERIGSMTMMLSRGIYENRD